MIENFEQTKKQLSELASVINSFKSEAVQLKIIELILGRQSEVEEPLTRANPKPRKATKRPKPTRKKAKEPSGKLFKAVPVASLKFWL